MDIENSISPIDGRYYNLLEPLRNIFSEKSLMETKIGIENRYLKLILNIVKSDTMYANIIKPKDNFYARIKEIELITNHDIKAIEYYLQELYIDGKCKDYIPFIHIGLTSEDINCMCRSIVLKQATELFVMNYIDKDI